MKNKLLTIFLILIFSSNFYGLSNSEEFTFKVTDIEIVDNGNIYKGNNRGEIATDDQLKIISNNFEYLKKINRLEANGDVELTDFANNIIINAEKIFYLKDEEKVYTRGKTLINVSNKYNIEGYDLTLLKNKMILSSNNKATITDNNSTIYKLNAFEYSINEEILKGKEILVITNSNTDNSDEYFFETAFLNLRENKFLAKDINVKLHKTLFGDPQNDPRINAVSGYGDKFITNFEKGVFTSCKKTDKCPPWKITANKIKHDKTKKQIIYKDAWLEIYDFPIFYFPKFFHPDPTVKRQSGFLTPEFGSSQNLGSSVYTPYFYALSDDKDMTIKPRLFGDNKFVLQSEYRQITKNSFTIADFSFAKGHDSNLSDKGDTRSHFFSNTLIDLSLNNYTKSMLEVNYQKSSNDNYLKLFNLESPLLLENNDVLESLIKLDLEHEGYDLTTSFEMYETISGSNTDRYQYVLPSYNFSKNFGIESLNGNFNLNSYGSNTLSETNVTTSTISNDLNYSSYNLFFDNGIKTNFEIQLKNINSIGKNNIIYKNSPQSELMSAYNYNISLPLLKKDENSINSLIPKLSLRLSPHEMKNNIAKDRRINIDNIFLSNRLSLEDSLEAGESITLGLDFVKEKVTVTDRVSEIEQYFDLKLATVFRPNEEKNIPINSTLNKKTSNLFGEINFQPNEIISLGYDFSVSNDISTFEYSALNAKFNYNDFSTQFNYIEESGVIGSTNLIENTTVYNFNENNSLSFSTRRNRELDLTEYYDLIYEYKNDCLVAGIKYKKNYYNDADIKPVEELFFSITIIPLATFSPDKMILK
jgi:LPS-assembly protein